MKLSKKWLPAGFAAIMLAGLLAGCGNKTPADQAFKEAYSKMWSDSYNYEGEMTVDIKADDSAIVGTKGGLSEAEAQQELQFAEQLKGPDGQKTIAILQNGKVTFHGAVDSKNMKYDIVLGINYDQDGVKASFEVPALFDLKDEPALYIDPKAAKAFNVLPPQLEGKLVKFTINDIPGLTAEQKAKFKSDGPVFKKVKEIITNSITSIDPKAFKDVDVSDAAKKAGATRTIQMTLTPEQSEKMSKDMLDQLLEAFGKDFGLTAEQMAQIKKEIANSNDGTKPFMGDAITEYSLNDKGQIVYVSNSQTLKGAKHIAKASLVMTLKDFDKPVLTVDPSKQASMTVAEIMQIMGAAQNHMAPPSHDMDMMAPEVEPLEQ